MRAAIIVSLIAHIAVLQWVLNGLPSARPIELSTIEALPVDLVPILLEYFGMTEREAEVVFLVARGLSTKEIAAELCLSTHTVNDHLKVIFSKAGVSSRGELVARLFADYVMEPYHSAVRYLG